MRLDRRELLQAGLAAGLGFWAAGGVSAEEKKSASALEKLNVAAIGVGGKGESDCLHGNLIGNVVAICDIDDKRTDKMAEKMPKAAKFADFRELLEKMESKIDAVIVSTPDHTHAVAAAMAMKLRKHVYCQKPLTHSVYEARRLRELASEFKVCTQMGNQGTALDGFRNSVELLKSGALGKVTEVHVWTNRPTGFWKQSPDVRKRPDPAKAPANVHWDLFVGPAPDRPYAPGYHPFAWRGWQDFGTGALGDMACHTANMPFMGLDLGYPSTISAECEEMNEETFPAWAKVTYEFPARGSFAPCKLFWYEGTRDKVKLTPPIELLQGTAKGYSGSGCLIVAEKATLFSPADYGQERKLIGKDAADIKKPETTLKRRGGNNDEQQKIEWAEAIKAGNSKLALANFDYAALLTEVVLLGNVAMRAGKKLTYNSKDMTFDVASANKYLKREYRAGWKL
jgi:predicted dehydrogenase